MQLNRVICYIITMNNCDKCKQAKERLKDFKSDVVELKYVNIDEDPEAMGFVDNYDIYYLPAYCFFGGKKLIYKTENTLEALKYLEELDGLQTNLEG